MLILPESSKLKKKTKQSNQNLEGLARRLNPKLSLFFKKQIDNSQFFNTYLKKIISFQDLIIFWSLLNCQ
jgi:hypothetical protein